MPPLVPDLVSSHDAAAVPPRRHGQAPLIAVIACVSVLALWIRSGFPPEIWAGAGDDDALFVRLAHSLISGKWLGPYDNLTLVKGMGFPLFIAWSFAMGVPLKMAETILNLVVGGMVAVATGSWSRSRLVAGSVFIAIALSPVQWSQNLSRVLREPFYSSLSMLALLLPIVLLSLAFSSLFVRSRWPLILLVVMTGIVWAWYWLTREEGLWLLPAIVGAIAVQFVGLARGRHIAGLRHGVWAGGLLVGAGLLAAFLCSLVATANSRAYGRYELVEVKSGPFEHAYGALYRVIPDRRVRYVVFPSDVRQRVYAVSPAALELKPFFEGKGGQRWRLSGCAQVGQRNCPEILSGWFQWALRDAVAAAGHYNSAAASAAFYERMAQEIDAACDRGRLRCGPPRRSLAPPFEVAFVRDAFSGLPVLANAYRQHALTIQSPGYSVVIPGEAVTDEKRVMAFATMVGNAMPTARAAADAQAPMIKRDHIILLVARMVAALYAPVFLVLLALSPIGLVILWRTARSAEDHAVLALLAGSVVGVAMRMALLCYLDATAIPSLNSAYASPMALLLIVIATVATIGGGVRLWTMRQARSRQGRMA